MPSSPKIDAAKAAILKKRRQRIRRTTYPYVASIMIEDATMQQEFRHRLVLDWWNRIIDPLDAESFDQERLRYFRKRLREHDASAAHNAEVRQGTRQAKTKRRLSPMKLEYCRHQVKRLSDRGLNYAAAARAVAEHDAAYEALTTGLVGLPVLRPSPHGRLEQAVRAATSDGRFQRLAEKISADTGNQLPGWTASRLQDRLEMFADRFHPVWLYGDDYVSTKRREGLIRKLEDEYSLLINDLDNQSYEDKKISD